MDFDLSEEQSLLKDSIDSFLGDHFANEKLIGWLDHSTALDRPLWNGISELGLNRILAPEESGCGLGMGLLTLAVVAERLAWHGAPLPVAEAAFAAWACAVGCSPVAEDIASGATVAALALCEPGGRWLSDQWTLDGARLTGQKTNVVRATDTDIFLVGLKDGGLGLVDATAAGVTIEPFDTLDMTRPMANVWFQEVAVERLKTSPSTAATLMDGLLICAAAGAYGAAARAADMAVEYAKMREQFGRLIGSFQALKHQLANMAVDIEPCRYLCWYAAHSWDLGLEAAPRMAAVAKAHVTDVAVKTARAAVEAHGGIGYTWEYPLHVFLKRAMAERTMYGLPAMHRDRAAMLGNW